MQIGPQTMDSFLNEMDGATKKMYTSIYLNYRSIEVRFVD